MSTQVRGPQTRRRRLRRAENYLYRSRQPDALHGRHHRGDHGGAVHGRGPVDEHDLHVAALEGKISGYFPYDASSAQAGGEGSAGGSEAGGGVCAWIEASISAARSSIAPKPTPGVGWQFPKIDN